jgi:hypothetical protein
VAISCLRGRGSSPLSLHGLIRRRTSRQAPCQRAAAHALQGCVGPARCGHAPGVVKSPSACRCRCHASGAGVAAVAAARDGFLPFCHQRRRPRRGDGRIQATLWGAPVIGRPRLRRDRRVLHRRADPCCRWAVTSGVKLRRVRGRGPARYCSHRCKGALRPWDGIVSGEARLSPDRRTNGANRRPSRLFARHCHREGLLWTNRRSGPTSSKPRPVPPQPHGLAAASWVGRSEDVISKPSAAAWSRPAGGALPVTVGTAR